MAKIVLPIMIEERKIKKMIDNVSPSCGGISEVILTKYFDGLHRIEKYCTDSNQ